MYTMKYNENNAKISIPSILYNCPLNCAQQMVGEYRGEINFNLQNQHGCIKLCTMGGLSYYIPWVGYGYYVPWVG